MYQRLFEMDSGMLKWQLLTRTLRQVQIGLSGNRTHEAGVSHGRMSLTAIICIYGFLFLPAEGIAQIKIRLYELNKSSTYAKEIFEKYRFSLVVDALEFPITIYADTLIEINNIDESVMDMLRTRGILLIKISKGCECYIAEFPNRVFNDRNVLTMDFYMLHQGDMIRSGKRLKRLKRIGISYVTNEYSYRSHYRVKSQRLIKCSHYFRLFPRISPSATSPIFPARHNELH